MNTFFDVDVSYLNDQDSIIFPTTHYITYLIVRHTHETFHHISHETTIKTVKIHTLHLSNAWETLVRSIKTSISSICPHMNFNDETLTYAMLEAEFIVNSRPLTFVSLDTNDDEAFTSNYLINWT